MSLQNQKIDYSLFEKYDKDYFLNTMIVPLKEDDICLYLAICKESKLQNIKNKFPKLLKFKEFDKNDILFIHNFIDVKIELYLLVENILSNNNLNNNIDDFLNSLLSLAIKSRSSDIHIEVFKKLIIFRFRIDGKLKTFFSSDIKFFPMISSYLKLISNLDITQVRLPLEGVFSRTILEKRFEFRFSSMPVNNFESIVLRILDNKNILKSIKSLGFSENIYCELKKAISLTQGLILIAGPTGSGKTTTLYSILNELATDEKKIITVEDPIEYKIDNLSQIQVNSKIGLSFELILKNILRQDPDIIFIGEIRDKLSLDIALKASLTGHLVIASIHANNSIDTITRLFDLEAESFLVSSSLKYVLSQRLVLRFCESCNKEGCKKCNYTSFYDRTGIGEILKIDEDISSMILKKENIKKISDNLAEKKFQSLFDDGLQKVAKGETSLEEVYKVINY